jgi:hypothetical protein
MLASESLRQSHTAICEKNKQMAATEIKITAPRCGLKNLVLV